VEATPTNSPRELAILTWASGTGLPWSSVTAPVISEQKALETKLNQKTKDTIKTPEWPFFIVDPPTFSVA
jgi:hypothetical protein